MKLADIKDGDTIVLDGGFTCAPAGPVLVAHEPGRGLFFRCKEGQHFIDGQENPDGELAGISKAGGQ